MKKILALIALFAFTTSTAFANVQISQDGTNKGQFRKLNLRDGVTVDGSGNVDFDAINFGASTVFEGTTADAFETTLAVTDPTADRTATLPDQTGTVQLSGAATALTAGAAVTLTVAPGNRLYTDTITTDNQDQTITFSGAGSAGDEVTIIFVTDAAGSGDEVITFHSTLVRSTGTLTLANAASSRYVVRFMSDGTKWNEISRTAVQAA